MSHLMTKDDRDNLARNIQKLLRATYASPDPDGLMGKLRAALDGLVALPAAATAVEKGHQTETGVLGVKRSLGAIDEEIEGTIDAWDDAMRCYEGVKCLCMYLEEESVFIALVTNFIIVVIVTFVLI